MAEQPTARKINYTRPWLYPKQEEAFFNDARYSVVEASTKAGKAQPLDASIYTPTGPRPMGAISPGDTVFTPTGTASVRAIYPQGEQDIYRITFSDGSSTECTADHLWEVHADRRDYRRGFQERIDANPDMARRKDRKPWPRVMETRDLMHVARGSFRRMWISVTEPVPFESQAVPIDPYLLGALLGDGGFTNESVFFSNIDEEILTSVSNALPPHYELRHADRCNWRLHLTLPYQKVSDRLIPALSALGLMGKGSHEKHIPAAYRYNSAAIRLALIRGLMDTDGYVGKMGQPYLDQTSEQLAHDAIEILESLGAICSLSTKRGSYVKDGKRILCRTVYRIRITYHDAAQLFSLTRKRDQCRPKRRSVKRTFRSIEHVGRKPAQCIEIDDPRGLYLTDRFICTHNTIGCIAWLIEQAWTTGKKNRHYWWVAPWSNTSQIAYERIKAGLTEGSYTKNDAKNIITLANGAVIDFKSADNVDGLFGEDVYACVMDEFTRCREEAWFALRTIITATQAPIRFIGNVKGRANWGYIMARRAEAGEPGMHYSKITAYDAVEAGVFPMEELEDAKRQLPDHVFRELYLAEAADDGGNPFGIDAIALQIGPLSEQKPVVFGIDLAKSYDWTVCIGLDHSGDVCSFDRWQAPWQDTIRKIVAITGNTPALVDSTGVGDPILEALQAASPTTYTGFKFTSSGKQQLMEQLAMAIQQRTIRYPMGTIVSELESFEYYHTRTGVRYEAPSGAHDDCVMALALALHHWGPNRRDLLPYWWLRSNQEFRESVLNPHPAARFLGDT